MKPLADCHLYAFVDTAYLHGRAPEAVAEQLCQGGADIIQLRAKNSSVEEVRRLAQAILPVTHRAGVPLVINDHLALAQELGAEVCHLGQEDFQQIADCRLPIVDCRIGLSTHAPEQAQRAVAAGADYIAIGPVYATGTKPTAKPVTLEYVRWASKNVTVPWFAIGGITLENLDAVLAAGARRICVVSAILNADDVAGECRKYKKRLG